MGPPIVKPTAPASPAKPSAAQKADVAKAKTALAAMEKQRLAALAAAKAAAQASVENQQLDAPPQQGVNPGSIPRMPSPVPEEKNSVSATLPDHPTSNHEEFKLSQLYTSEIKNLFAGRAQGMAETFEMHQAKAAELKNAEQFVSAEFRQKQLETPYCMSLTDEVNALKTFVQAKENTRAKYIENLLTQKKAENKKAQDAAIAEADAMKEKHGMMEALSEQTDHDHQSRTKLAQNIEDQLTEYIGQDAKRAEADLKSAIEHATMSANTVEANSFKRHTTLNAKHEDLSGKHAAFAKQTTADVGAINAKFEDNDEDKERRHVKTLKDANEFTTEVETKLNARATGLQNMHDALRTDHTNLDGVVGTHTNNLDTTKK